MDLTNTQAMFVEVIEKRFNSVLNKINLLKNDSNYEEMLKYNPRIKLDLYKYYKQATIGDCNIAEPSYDNKDEYGKWSAWNEAFNVNKKDAMISYINIYESHLVKINEIRINDIEKKLELLLNNATS